MVRQTHKVSAPAPERDRDRPTGRQINRQTDRAQRQTDTNRDVQTDTATEADGQTDKQAGRRHESPGHKALSTQCTSGYNTARFC